MTARISRMLPAPAKRPLRYFSAVRQRADSRDSKAVNYDSSTRRVFCIHRSPPRIADSLSGVSADGTSGSSRSPACTGNAGSPAGPAKKTTLLLLPAYNGREAMNALAHLLIFVQLLDAPFGGVCAAGAPCDAVHGMRDAGQPVSACCATIEAMSQCDVEGEAADGRSAAQVKLNWTPDLLGSASAASTWLPFALPTGGSALLDALPAGLLSLQAQSVRLQI